MRNYIIAAFAAFIIGIFGLAAEASASVRCHDGSVSASTRGCPPPAPIKGPVKSTQKFRDECVWLPFPTHVRKPIIFLKQEGDDACIGKNWRRWCQECVDWAVLGIRGPVNGPARGAKIVWRLHNGQTGISVPRDRLARIKRDAGWCDYGITGKYDSEHF